MNAPCVPAPMSVARQASRGAALAWALACAAPAALLVAPGALALTLHVIQKAGAPLRLDTPPIAARRHPAMLHAPSRPALQVTAARSMQAPCAPVSRRSADEHPSRSE